MKQILDGVGFINLVGFSSAMLLERLNIASNFILKMITSSAFAQIVFNISACIALIYTVLKTYNMFVTVLKNRRDSKMNGLFKIKRK